MDIHNVTKKTIRGTKIELVFFDSSKKDMFDETYVDLINNSDVYEDVYYNMWYIKDKKKIEYKLININLNINGSAAVPKIDKNIFLKNVYNSFLDNNGLSKDTKYNEAFIKKHINPLTIYKRKVYRPQLVWSCDKILENQFVVILIVNNEIVGKGVSEILPSYEMNNYLEGKNIMYKNMNLYISRIDVRKDFQGKGLCKPLVSFMISNLKKLGYQQLAIDNGSKTNKGVPACICYLKSGIDNDYKLRYLSNDGKKSFKVMKLSDCKKKPIPRTYFYISADISRNALTKFKKIVKTKKFKDLIKQKRKKTKKKKK